MKFPISREALQTFDPVQEKKARDNIANQNHINSLVNEICSEIQSRMEWTMPTGVVLHSYLGTGTLDSSRNEHKKIMSEKQFLWDRLKYIIPGSEYGINVSEVTEDVMIPLLVAKLKETFIGCDIIIGPMNKYLIIDWS